MKTPGRTELGIDWFAEVGGDFEGQAALWVNLISIVVERVKEGICPCAS
jgi:hypothetical protein